MVKSALLELEEAAPRPLTLSGVARFIAWHLERIFWGDADGARGFFYRFTFKYLRTLISMPAFAFRIAYYYC